MATSSVSEAKAHLTQSVRDPDQEDVVLTRHGQPVGVIMSARRYESLLDRVDDLEDRLSIFEARVLLNRSSRLLLS